MKIILDSNEILKLRELAIRQINIGNQGGGSWLENGMKSLGAFELSDGKILEVQMGWRGLHGTLRFKNENI